MSIVTSYLESLGGNDRLSVTELTSKTVMLMELTRPARSADLANLNLDQKCYSPEGVSFIPIKLAKQSRQNKEVKEVFFPAFPDNALL